MHRHSFRPLHDVARLLFPTLCCHCGRPLVGDERDLCTSCMAHLSWARHAAVSGNEVEMRVAGRVPLQAGAALLFFRKDSATQSVIHQIKYYGNTRLAHQFGTLLGQELLQSGRFADVDLLVPVPLHPRRVLQRGYNQSQLLCEALSRVMGLPIDRGNLYRRRYTHSQTHKTRLQRMDNMQAVFAIRHPQRWEGRHILLVDDILTTGATSEGCYQVLRTIPGLRISLAVLAVTRN